MNKKEEKKILFFTESLGRLKNNYNQSDYQKLKEEFLRLSDFQKQMIKNYDDFLFFNLLEKNNEMIKNTPLEKLMYKIADTQIEVTYKTVFLTDFGLKEKKASLDLSRILCDFLEEKDDKMILYNKLKEIEEEVTKLERIMMLKSYAKAFDELVLETEKPTSLYDEANIMLLREAYEALEDEAKSYVNEYEKLLEYETIIAKLRRAKEIDDRILLIEIPVTLSDETILEHLHNDIEQLDQETKSYITNMNQFDEAYRILNLLQEERKRIESAKLVTKEIESVYDTICNNNVALAQKLSAFEMVVSLYNDLDDIEKSYVTNASLLEEIQDVLDKLIIKEEKLVQAKDIFIRINNLPRKVEKAQKEEIFCLRNDYENLDNDAKALITNVEILEIAEEQINALIEAANFESKIENVDFDNDDISKLRNYYDEYSFYPQLIKSYIHGINEYCKKVQKRISLEENRNKARLFDQKILALPSEITLENKADIDRLNEEFRSLPNGIKMHLEQYHILEKSNEKIVKIEKAKVIEEMIDNIPSNLTVLDIHILEEIFNLIEEFDNEYEYISNMSDLESIYHHLMKERNEALEVYEMIHQIEDVLIDDGDDIAKARFKYELLSNEQKSLVSNYYELVEAEKEFKKLEFIFIEDVKENNVKLYVEEQIDLLEEAFNNPSIPKDKKEKLLSLVKQSLNDVDEKLLDSVDNIEVLKRIENSGL